MRGNSKGFFFRPNHGCIQAIIGVVGKHNCFFNLVVTLNVDERPKDLLALKSGNVLDVGDYGWCVEERAEFGKRSTAGNQSRATVDCVLNKLGDSIELSAAGEGSDILAEII